ncbi:alpha-2,8-sialyltransferase 8E isoform 2-T2 [Ciconia maguari]
MGYTDPSSSRDLLGNRTLFFIFICAFAVVTLLQQILYGRNYLKRGLQFSWQNGEELANWTGTFNFTDDGAVKSGSDTGTRYFEFYEGPLEYNSTKCLELRQDIIEVKVLSMVKQTELFDRWKSLQMCKWEMNVTEANLFKSTLSRCCNAPAFLFTTQKNTPLGTKLKYEMDTSGIFHISQEIFKMFPKQLHMKTEFCPKIAERCVLHESKKDMPYHRSQFKKCAVVGNGGILKNSRCGREIDSADFVFRYSPAAHGGPHAGAGGCLKEAVTPWEACAGAGSWQDLWKEEPMLEQFMKNCSLWEGLTLEKFMEDCLLWEGPHAGAGEECEESSP